MSRNDKPSSKLNKMVQSPIKKAKPTIGKPQIILEGSSGPSSAGERQLNFSAKGKKASK
jgi:hypothetical protein